MATTAAAIRDVMLSTVEALTPSIEAGTKFIRFREQHPAGFRDWAEAHPGECLRRVSIRALGQARPAPVTNTLIEETSDTFEIVVAYPASLRFGSLIELDDVIESDSTQIHRVIGPPGYASLTAQATVLHEEGWSREEAGPVVFAVVRYRVDWFRSVAA